MTKTILLAHGAWLNAHSWEGFKKRYEAKGYTVMASSDGQPDPPRASLKTDASMGGRHKSVAERCCVQGTQDG